MKEEDAKLVQRKKRITTKNRSNAISPLSLCLSVSVCVRERERFYLDFECTRRLSLRSDRVD